MKNIRASSYSSSDDDCLYESQDIVDEKNQKPCLSSRGKPSNLKINCAVSVNKRSEGTKGSPTFSLSKNSQIGHPFKTNKAAFDDEFDMDELEAAFAAHNLEEAKGSNRNHEKFFNDVNDVKIPRRHHQELSEYFEANDMDFYLDDEPSANLCSTPTKNMSADKVSPLPRKSRWERENLFVNAPARPKEASGKTQTTIITGSCEKRNSSWSFSPLRE